MLTQSISCMELLYCANKADHLNVIRSDVCGTWAALRQQSLTSLQVADQSVLCTIMHSFILHLITHRVSSGRRKWYPPADANVYGRHTPWLAD